MFLFAVTALEQFVDKLHQWPQYLNSIVTIPALKNNPQLFEKVNEKYNEINNKNKGRDNSNQIDPKNNFQFNNMVNNLLNFDYQIEEKRSNKDLSQVSKMPVFPNDEFNRNFKTIANTDKQQVHPPPQFIMQPGNFIPSHNFFPQQQGSKNQINKSKIFFLI